MKKIYLLLSALLAIGTSCSNDLDGMMSEENLSDSKVMVVDDNRPYFVREDGSLCFTSVEAYYALTDSLVNLSSVEFENWEKQVGFTSYRTYTDAIVDRIYDAEELENDDEVSRLLAENSQYVYRNANGLVEARIVSETYKCIANKDGVFYFNNTKNVVDGNAIGVEKDGNVQLQKVYALGDGVSPLTENSAIDYRELVYTTRDNERQVCTFPRMVENLVYTEASGAKYIRHQMEIKIYGKKKKRRKWVNYKTDKHLEEIHAVFRNIPISVKPDGTVKEVSNSYVFNHTARLDYGDKHHVNTQVFDLGVLAKNYEGALEHPYCIHYRGTTRGCENTLYHEYAQYNYYNGAYDEKAKCPSHPIKYPIVFPGE